MDVACGTGNLAIPLARQGASVTGVDIAANLVVQARQRAADERLDVAFDEGDAEALPYPDAAFDIVVSMFGAMFAPRPELVASELARVLKPGGRLAMANWNPASFSGRMFKVGANHVPPPPGIPPPVFGAMFPSSPRGWRLISQISRPNFFQSISTCPPTPPEQSPSSANTSAPRTSPSAGWTRRDRPPSPPIWRRYGQEQM